jgi:spore photoproduct lyase
VAHKNAEVPSLFVREAAAERYQPKAPPHFRPERIVIAKGSRDDAQGRHLIDATCALYPQAEVITQADLPHNRVDIEAPDLLTQHYQGKKTLVFGVHQSALRFSAEDGNACPNYWHLSPYGFCPYDCRYCYLAGTPGVKHSPTVKVFVNLPQMLSAIETVATTLTKPMAFYIGKLQDALALDPLTGYSRLMVPFFARQRHARLTLLTKSANVENLLDLDHAGHTILSWSLNPPEIASAFEENVPPPQERLAAMQACAKAGYPLRAIIMPIIPVENWRTIYGRFLEQLLHLVPLQRITFGQICSYSGALHLMERKLGKRNPISNLLTGTQSPDGRFRFPFELRLQVYRHLIDQTQRIRPGLEIGLCLEERRTFEALSLTNAVGRCNCVV